MAVKFRHKRSTVQGKVPLVTDIDLGELAINTYDGKVYLKKNNGTESIVEVGAVASSASKLTTARSVALSGDITGSASFDGSANVSISSMLASSGATAGTYNNSSTAITPFTVDAKGRITATGAAVTITPAFSSITGKPTTLAGYGITDAASASHTHSIIGGQDTRSANINPYSYKGVSLHLKANTTDGLADGGIYHGVLNLTQWQDSSGGRAHQLGFTDNQNIYYRSTADGTTFTGWTKVWTASNLTNLNQLANGPGYLTSVPTPVSGDWFNNGFVSVSAGGVSEMGRFIDWHYRGSDTADYTARTQVDASGNLLHSKGITAEGSLKGNGIVVEGTSPTIHLRDTDATENNFWLHANSSKFYILSDQDNDGSWEVPHPLVLDNANDSLTVYGNTVWHTGNDGASSGLDADKLDGYQAAITATASSAAVRDASGDIHARLLRSEYGNENTISGAIAYRVESTSGGNNYLRFCSDTAAIRSYLGLAIGTTAGTVAAGDHTHSIPLPGNWFNGGYLCVSTAGVVETGRYLDWHYNGSDTTDHTARTEIDASGNLTHTHGLKVKGTGGLGYAFGGTVTQLTSRDTGVTLNAPSGTITLVSTTVIAGTTNKFTFTNSCIQATDVVQVSVRNPGSGVFNVFVNRVAAGVCDIVVQNLVSVSTAQTPSINFVVLKGANA